MKERVVGKGEALVEIELFAAQLGGIALVAVNGEMFSRFTQRLREMTGRPMFVVAYCNAAFGYIPTVEAYEEGGYEVETAHFFYNSFRPKAGGLEMLSERAAGLIERVWRI